MIVNLIHRPGPERKYEMFRLQQNMAHELGLKVTLLVPYDFLFDVRAVCDIQADHAQYGDEIGLWLGELTGGRMAGTVESPEPFLWLHTAENKQIILRTALEQFRAAFGKAPDAFGAYHVDAVSMQLLHSLCPEIKISIAGCFEEGVKVFHGCNHSWYLFNEGMPFGPWYPAKENTLRPASGEADWCGVVAVPHLARDMALSYEGRNDFFASHPANVQRAMANDGAVAPYVLNLLDVYRLQERLNNGFSYTNVFVGPNWLSGSANVQDSDEITQGLYREYLAYIAQLRNEGKLQDMYMREFAGWYRENVPIGSHQLFDAREILYGGGKRYIWYCDSDLRVLFDLCQGGSIGDLRAYAAHQPRCTGADRPEKAIGSNPYLIQSQYRTGNAHHFADGARSTLLLRHGGQTLDLADFPAKVSKLARTENGMELLLSPVSVQFRDGLTVSIQTEIRVLHGGVIRIRRKLLSSSEPDAVVDATEYIKGCWGTTEYPENMEGIRLCAQTDQAQRSLSYAYLGRRCALSGGGTVSAEIPAIETAIRLKTQTEAVNISAEEGYVFSPYYTLRAQYALTMEREMESVICLEKHNLSTDAPCALDGKTTLS